MKKKVLLMGRSGAGKTSMRSIIFANYIARDTMRIGATIDIEHSHVRFLGNLVLSLWDCGGQEVFMESYFASQRSSIFCDVEVLIYVFDVESREKEKDVHYYQTCLEAIHHNSPNAKVFCLIHKMDLVKGGQQGKLKVFMEKSEELVIRSKPFEVICFTTSIWDESLYKAWSAIIYNLIPNVTDIENSLQSFAEILEADEVLMFERATFLTISHCQRREHNDPNRFEKVSNIIKQFKLSCSKFGTSFNSMEIRNSNFSAFIEMFTTNTFIMIIIADSTIPSSIITLNVKNAKPHFQSLEKEEYISITNFSPTNAPQITSDVGLIRFAPPTPVTQHSLFNPTNNVKNHNLNYSSTNANKITTGPKERYAF